MCCNINSCAMDKIRKFLDENGGLHYEEGLPSGDEERFFSRLDKPREIHFRRVIHRPKVSFIRVIAVPLAACMLVILALQLYLRSFQAGDLLDSIYSDYRDQVLALSSEIIQLSETEEEAKENERTIEIITFEAIPMSELLPEELSLKERAGIMSGYYAQRLEGMKRLRDSINNNK